jgi:hypothetical protein
MDMIVPTGAKYSYLKYRYIYLCVGAILGEHAAAIATLWTRP